MAALICLCHVSGQSLALYVTNSIDSGAQIAPTRLIVKFKTGVAPVPSLGKRSAATTGLVEVDALNERFGVAQLSPLFGISEAGGRDVGLQNVCVLTVDSQTDILSMQREYEQLGSVEYAEPDYRLQLFDAPNDPFYWSQWSMNNGGQGYYHVLRRDGDNNDSMVIEQGLPGADIDADTVFQIAADHTATVVVAIIDTGVDIDHPDLVGNIWTNAREIPDNHIDDDHNGYVDDVCGWDYSANNQTIFPIYEDNDPTDRYGHGTHVAGIVAAVSNNGIGVAGLVPNCKIMALKIHPWMSSSIAARAIIYATDNGAEVINMSWGSTAESRLLKDALDYARSKGVVPCAATGNFGDQRMIYPAVFPSTIAVGATNSRDRVTAFSSYGTHIDVCAPGESILSLRADSTDVYGEAPANEPYVHIVAENYYEASGTSMAAPHVAGIAACLKSTSPGLTAEKIQEIIQLSADDIIDPYGNGMNAVGWDKYSGYGRVNLRKALEMVPIAQAKIERPKTNELVSGNIEIFGTAAGAAFQLQYGYGANPSHWYLITSSASAVSHGTLGNWAPESLDGRYTLRLLVGEYNVSQVTICVANHTNARIIAPRSTDTLTSAVEIVGTAMAPDFDFFTLEYGRGATPESWITVDTVGAPAHEEAITEWDTGILADGLYTLRLTLHTETGAMLTDQVSVFVMSPFSGNNGWKVSLGATATIVPNYGDFDNDGKNEIIVGTSKGIKFYNADGSLKTNGLPSLPQYDFRLPIAVGNLDGDGIDDFVAVSENPARLFVYRSGASLIRVPLTATPGDTTFVRNIESEFPLLFLKDIDHDGRDEIHYLPALGSDGLSRPYFIFNADGTPWQCAFPFAERTYSCLAADLDNDSLDEIYCYGDSLRRLDLCGSVMHSISLDLGPSPFTLTGMSVVDIDGDNRLDLLLFGCYQRSNNIYNYWLFAFDSGLTFKAGWPHEIQISRYFVPMMPVFGDINGDGSLEYVISSYDLDYGYIYAWNIDGAPYGGSASSTGLFATVPHRSMLNMPVLADIDGTPGAEIVASALPDAWQISQKQTIVAWDRDAQLLQGWPLTVEYDPEILKDCGNTPIIGDINKDGNVELAMTTALGDLVFINFPNTPFSAKDSPSPFWRYNRRLNNIGMRGRDQITDVIDHEVLESIPNQVSLSQNYPNPFNFVTMIPYSLPRACQTEMTIINVVGQKVKTLVDAIQPQGFHTILWDGADQRGASVASGVYFCRIRAGDREISRKMVLLK